MKLTDTEYSSIKDILPGNETWKERRGVNNGLFIDAVLFAIINNVKWRQLPKEYGK